MDIALLWQGHNNLVQPFYYLDPNVHVAIKHTAYMRYVWSSHCSEDGPERERLPCTSWLYQAHYHPRQVVEKEVLLRCMAYFWYSNIYSLPVLAWFYIAHTCTSLEYHLVLVFLDLAVAEHACSFRHSPNLQILLVVFVKAPKPASEEHPNSDFPPNSANEINCYLLIIVIIQLLNHWFYTKKERSFLW